MSPLACSLVHCLLPSFGGGQFSMSRIEFSTVQFLCAFLLFFNSQYRRTAVTRHLHLGSPAPLLSLSDTRQLQHLWAKIPVGLQASRFQNGGPVIAMKFLLVANLKLFIFVLRSVGKMLFGIFSSTTGKSRCATILPVWVFSSHNTYMMCTLDYLISVTEHHRFIFFASKQQTNSQITNLALCLQQTRRRNRCTEINTTRAVWTKSLWLPFISFFYWMFLCLSLCRVPHTTLKANKHVTFSCAESPVQPQTHPSTFSFCIQFPLHRQLFLFVMMSLFLLPPPLPLFRSSPSALLWRPNKRCAGVCMNVLIKRSIWADIFLYWGWQAGRPAGGGAASSSLVFLCLAGSPNCATISNKFQLSLPMSAE